MIATLMPRLMLAELLHMQHTELLFYDSVGSFEDPILGLGTPPAIW